MYTGIADLQQANDRYLQDTLTCLILVKDIVQYLNKAEIINL